jgi:hypothetical protein
MTYSSSYRSRSTYQSKIDGILAPGTSGDAAKEWLAAQGIPPYLGSSKSPYYVIVRRAEWTMSNGECAMESNGQTIAERAGLRTDDVDWYICIVYSDAARSFPISTSIRVYFFFDSKDRLLNCWVRESHTGP